ncbi:MAG: PAS domain S-box protein [Candidatus Aminicenantes bacterium]|nr:PAS domain S-box protein [Candidatus Aminicenantes bacterium]
MEPIKRPKSDIRVPIVIFVVLVLFVAAGGWLYFSKGQTHVKKAAALELEAVADLKVGQIVNWRRNLLSDALVISHNPFNDIRIIPYLEKGTSADGAPEDIRAWMRSLIKDYEYMDAVLMDDQAGIRFSVGASPSQIDASVRAVVEEVCRTGMPFFSDFHKIAAIEKVHLDLYAPLVSSRSSSGKPRCAGVFLFRIDPNSFLYPAIQTWPVPSRSAETLLIRREGDSVLFLNELRHRKGTAMVFKLPISDQDLPAALAVQGREGTVEGRDYRGVPVLAVIRKVPDSPWFMITKKDTSEILVPMRIRMVVTAIFLAGLCIGVGLALLLWAKGRDAHFYRRQYEAEHDRLALIRHFEYLHKYANDIILLADRNHRIIEANERACAAYGYAREELLGKFIPDFRSPQVRPDFEPTIREAERRGGLIFETLHQRKDGKTFPVEISMRIFEIEGKKYHQAIIRDITERKKAEEQNKEALREKDVLLREIHHRVKNNMQIISSLLSLQAQSLPDPEVKAIFRESQDRIRTMALVHEKLYQTNDLSRIDFAEYIRSLAAYLFRTYQDEAGRVQLKTDMDKTFLDINTSIPCGLIVNELVSNALKHAFPDGKKGEITIELRESEGGTLRLTVRDNGIGFPEGVDLRATDTLGLQIVGLLVDQIDGKIDVKRDRGAAFTVTFKPLSYKPRL